MFVFLLEPSPPTKAVIQERWCSGDIPLPSAAPSCLAALEGWCGRLGPRQAGGILRRPECRQPLAPGSAGGIRSRRESSPRLSIPGRGSGRLSACLGPSPCSLPRRSEESGRIWVRAPAGEASRPLAARLSLVSQDPGPRWGRPRLRLGQSRGICRVLMLFLSSPPFPSHFLLSFSKFIQQISIEHLCAWLARPTLQGPVLGKAAALVSTWRGAIGGQQGRCHAQSWACNRPP